MSRGVVCGLQQSRQAAMGESPDYAHIEAQKMQQLLQAAEADEGWINKVVSHKTLDTRLKA